MRSFFKYRFVAKKIALAKMLMVISIANGPPVHALENLFATPYRASLWPMTGGIGQRFALGIGLNGGYGIFTVGARAFTSTDMCGFCTPEGESQINGLAGLRAESGLGTVSAYTGISRVHREYVEVSTAMTAFGLEEGASRKFFTGFGIPLEVDASWGPRGAGLGLAFTADFYNGDQSLGLLFSIPMGILHG